jgi:hypothetical protein
MRTSSRAVLAIVEGEDRDEASRFAFSLAREEVHRDGAIVTGVFEVRDEMAELIATAGYSRLSTGGQASSFSFLEPLVSV